MDDLGIWQEHVIEHLRSMLEDDPSVVAMAIVGSIARGQADAWSDLDLVIVVQIEALSRFFPDRAWLAPLGRIYAFEQHRDERSAVTRLCFDDLRRLDIVIVTSDALRESDPWANLLANGVRQVFSRNAAITHVFDQSYLTRVPEPPDDAFAILANGFWFKAIVAVQRLVRGDRLVALHLYLELVQECAVLAMMLRDRSTGTNQHRGGVGNDLVAELEPTRQPFSDVGILEGIRQCAIIFDRLAHRWDEQYQDHRGPLLTWLVTAKQAIS